MKKSNIFDKLFICEIANNHMGDVEHGKMIIKKIYEKCMDLDVNLAFKFQYRDLDTFIHPEYRQREDIKYVKRFSETRLTKDEFLSLRNLVKDIGAVSICTPFDENSVDLIEEHDYDIIKIASCSMTDWPLLERIALTDKPVIVSTAGYLFDDIDKTDGFLKHRGKQFAIMHCVAEYPTLDSNLQLNRIDMLKQRYPDNYIGYSTHERPDNFEAVKIAVAKGVRVFEKHVGLNNEIYRNNAYSADPEQVRKWINSAMSAYDMCGISDEISVVSKNEKQNLRSLQRGVFAAEYTKAGNRITVDDVTLSIPNIADQVTANDMSKYTHLTAKEDIKKGEPVMFSSIHARYLRGQVLDIINRIKPVIAESGVCLPDKLNIELSHHFDIDNFEKWGATIINCINREYCKKIIILLPGQKHPSHFHMKKEETFHLLYGDLTVNIEGEEREFNLGDMVVVERGKKHSFSSLNGALFEEISTTHYKDDSYYTDKNVCDSFSRKTYMTFWSDWMRNDIL